MKIDEFGVAHERRCCASYKSNIWSYDFVQSLSSEFTEPSYKARAEELKEEFRQLWGQVSDFSKLHIIDSISKLGLSYVFHKEIKEALGGMISCLDNASGFRDDLQSTSLCFRLLRQHGYNISQDLFINLIDEMGFLKEGVHSNLTGVLELFEASHLAVHGEGLLVKAKAFSGQYLINNRKNMDVDLGNRVAHALELPCHWRVTWFDVRQQIHAYELKEDKNPILLELAKLNFNICQGLHLQDLQELSRWWRNLGLIEHIDFTRDRLVESFLWTVGVGCEPQLAIFRKCLTKVVTFVLVIDDIYDIYGSLEELECFTSAIERWDYQQVQQLPDCMKICFKALQKTIDDIASDILQENGSAEISTYLRKAWSDFCKALLVEARWFHKCEVPSLEEYLKAAWITSSGPLISLIALLCTANTESEELRDEWGQSQKLIYHASLIIRLCNDLGTSAAELERGDTPSSIRCYMMEARVIEEIAREHIKKIISVTWSHVNSELISRCSEQETFVGLIINAVRVCHFIYLTGDGFSVQDQDTRKQVKHLLIKPVR